jgi:hypothetical protein
MDICIYICVHMNIISFTYIYVHVYMNLYAHIFNILEWDSFEYYPQPPYKDMRGYMCVYICIKIYLNIYVYICTPIHESLCTHIQYFGPPLL